MQSALVLITGVVAGLTSIPLTYFAVNSHREIRHLRHSHHTLRRLIVEVHGDRGGGSHGPHGPHPAEQRRRSA